LFWDIKKFKLVEAKPIFINKEEDDYGKQVCGRIILERRIGSSKGHQFGVYVAHMKSGKDKDKKPKEWQAKTIAEDIKKFRENHDIPVIFAADFNCHNEKNPQ